MVPGNTEAGSGSWADHAWQWKPAASFACVTVAKCNDEGARRV